MKLRINGESISVPSDIMTVEHVLEHFKLQDKIVIVEHNMHVLQKADHASRKLAEGDSLEIVHFVGGG
jgi:sulfur carrier protein